MRKTIVYILLSTFLFSSMEIALKMAGASFNAIQLNFLRFGLGALILWPLAHMSLKKNHLKVSKKAWGLFGLTGFVCVIVSMTLFQLAVETAKASTVAVVFSCNPVFALIFSYLLLHEKLSRSNLIAVLISVIGLLVIIDPLHLSNPIGLSLAVGSAITFGLYSIITRYGSLKYGFSGVTMTFFTFLTGTAELAVLMAMTHLPMIASALGNVAALHDFVQIPFFAGIAPSNLALLAYIGIGVTGGGFAFYFLAMENSDVSTASLVFFIKPALAPVLAMLILSEQITLPVIIGIVIILLGSLATLLGDRVASVASDLFKRNKQEEAAKEARIQEVTEKPVSGLQKHFNDDEEEL
ncbi:DMT family permease [Lactobacillus selangorensis]|uniref:DMT family permease n=1 Tax=Lactobacillus selangorensis TaxID=81857 RepID=A0A0R2FV21_9LACO|nr:DMT family transporter [Lactobacillus selangorensis]KRN29175.1 DMT family permease [Lactobacillus selangorensis]KRN31467.1 DMT family permease [Lactobacillus selangorensis]